MFLQIFPNLHKCFKDGEPDPFVGSRDDDNLPHLAIMTDCPGFGACFRVDTALLGAACTVYSLSGVKLYGAQERLEVRTWWKCAHQTYIVPKMHD